MEETSRLFRRRPRKDLQAPLLNKGPEDRKRTRFHRSYDQKPTDLDPGADHADYLVVFPREKEVPAPEAERISWSEAEDVWFRATPGFEEEKLAGVASLRQAWIEKFRVDQVLEGDSVPLTSFRALVRDHVVDLLRGVGLDVTCRMARDQETVYALCRAPERRLEAQAARVGYALPFKREVDPGRKFWLGGKHWDEHGDERYPELDEDALLYEKAQANEVLEDLYRAGKIPPEDLAVFDEEPTARHWSRRVHVLERVADRVTVDNRYPAHAPFETRRATRHLYDTVATARGPSLLQPSDRLLLAKQLLDRAIFLDVLSESGVLPCFFALCERGVLASRHDGSRRLYGSDVSRFVDSWCFFWRASPETCGAPLVTHAAYQEETPCPWHQRVFAQPLRDVRNYFGDAVALHFAWCAYYARSLIIPVLCIMFLSYGTRRTPGGLRSYRTGGYQVAVAAVVVIWAACLSEGWRVEERFCALACACAASLGTHTHTPSTRHSNNTGGSTSNDDRPDLQEVPRPKFQAQTRRLSPVTNTNEAWFDPRIRTRRIVLSWFVVLLCCGLQLALLFGVFQVEALAIRDKSVSPVLAIAWVACGLSAAAAIDSRLFKHVARYLTSYENHTYQPDHEAHLVAKRFAFEAVNQFGPVLFQRLMFSRRRRRHSTPSVRESTRRAATPSSRDRAAATPSTRDRAAAAPSTRDRAAAPPSSRSHTQVAFALFFQKSIFGRCAFSDCVTDAEVLASALFIGRFIGGLAGYYVSYRKYRKALVKGQKDVEAEHAASYDVEESTAVGGPPRWLSEVRGRQPIGSALRDAKLEVLIQLSLVASFSVVTVIVPLVACLEALLDFRGDAWCLVRATRRPIPQRANTIGEWNRQVRVATYIAILIQAGVVAFASSWLDGRGLNRRLLCFFAVEHCLQALYLFVVLVYPSEPDYLHDCIKRNAFVVKRHTRPAFHDDVTGADESGHVDRDDAVKPSTKPMSPRTARRLHYLRSLQDATSDDLRALRVKYSAALEAEEFRESCGISYSRRQPDLALGLVTLTVLEVRSLGSRDFPLQSRPQDLKIVVKVADLRGRRKHKEYDGAVAPEPQVSKPPRKFREAYGDQDGSPSEITEDPFGGLLVFSQCFTIAPVKTKHASLVIDLVDTKKKTKLASVSQPLADLAHQRTARLQLAMARSKEEKASRPVDCPPPVLYIKTRFRHSKLQPLKQEIYDVQAHQRKIQRDATNLKHGKPTEYDWDWPEDVVTGRRRSARRSVGRRGAAELEIGDGDGGVV